MSAIHAAVSCSLIQVSVTERMSVVLEIIRSVRKAFFFTHGANVCGGQANVVPDHRSRIKTNSSR